MELMGSWRKHGGSASDQGKGRRGDRASLATSEFQWSERSVLGSRDIDGQTREGERAGAKESMG
jgi:hypothetical protein